MTDIWHFYRSERLYLLKTTKEIMTKTWKEGSKHHATFADIFNQMEELSIGQSLLNQLEYVTRSEYFFLFIWRPPLLLSRRLVEKAKPVLIQM